MIKIRFRNKLLILLSGLSAIVIMVLEFYTGRDIRLEVLYIIPVGILAWNRRAWTAYVFAFLLPLFRFIFQIPLLPTEILHLAGVNALIRMIALCFYIYIIALAQQSSELKKKLKVLEGFLPICSSCKKIRNEKGDYEQIEKYISCHSEAEFSHGICPECAKKLYPEYINNESN